MPGMRNTLHEFKEGLLHSGSKTGPIVKTRRQAIAIGLAERRVGKRKVRPMIPAHKMNLGMGLLRG